MPHRTHQRPTQAQLTLQLAALAPPTAAAPASSPPPPTPHSYMLARQRARRLGAACALRSPWPAARVSPFSSARLAHKAAPPSAAAGRTKVPAGVMRHATPTRPDPKPPTSFDVSPRQAQLTNQTGNARKVVIGLIVLSLASLVGRGIYLAYSSEPKVIDPDHEQKPVAPPESSGADAERVGHMLPASDSQRRGGELVNLGLQDAAAIAAQVTEERAKPVQAPPTAFGGPTPKDVDMPDNFATRIGMKVLSFSNYWFPGALSARHLTPLQDRAVTIAEELPPEAYDQITRGVGESFVHADGVEGQYAGLSPVKFTDLILGNAVLGNTPSALVPAFGVSETSPAVARVLAQHGHSLTPEEAIAIINKRTQQEHIYLTDRQHRLLQLDLPFHLGLFTSVFSMGGSSSPPDEGEGVSHLTLAARARAPLEVWSVTVAQPELGVARRYTPLQSPLEAFATRTLDLVVKRYSHAEVPDYLHRLPVNSTIRAAGFNKEWDERWTLDAIERARKGQDPHPNALLTDIDLHASLPETSSELDTAATSTGPQPDVPRVKDVYLVVAGTGVAPAYQLVKSVMAPLQEHGVEAETCPDSGAERWQRTSDERALREKTKFTVLYAAPRPESFLLTPEWSELVQRYPGRVQVELFSESTDAPDLDAIEAAATDAALVPAREQLQQASKSWLSKASAKVVAIDGLPLHEGRIGEKDVKKALEPLLATSELPVPEKTSAAAVAKPTISTGIKRESAVLVCGPDGFIAAVAGPKGRDGRTQGPLGGILAHIGVRPENVWKL